MGCYSAIKKQSPDTWMNPENMLMERSQIQNATYSRIPFI